MPPINFFSRLGLYVRSSFISVHLCQQICAEMHLANTKPAGVTTNATDRIDELVRKTKIAQVSDEIRRQIKAALLATQDEISRHFQVTLAGCESPQFLTYRTGDFFTAHTDSSYAVDSHDYIQKRQISAVIFLNNSSDKQGLSYYSGGDLTLYGLVRKIGWDDYGFDVQGEAGTLIAFRSETYHEVTPVTQGERFTIVSWFY